MQVASVKINRRAEVALDGLSEADRRRLLETAEQLQHSDPSAWPNDQIVRLPDPEPLYLARFAPHLRAFLGRGADNEIEILDVVREETLHQFRTAGRNGASKDEAV